MPGGVRYCHQGKLLCSTDLYFPDTLCSLSDTGVRDERSLVRKYYRIHRRFAALPFRRRSEAVFLSSANLIVQLIRGESSQSRHTNDRDDDLAPRGLPTNLFHTRRRSLRSLTPMFRPTRCSGGIGELVRASPLPTFHLEGFLPSHAKVGGYSSIHGCTVNRGERKSI